MNSLTHRMLTMATVCMALFAMGCTSMDDGTWTTEDDLQEEIQLRLDQDALVERSNVRVTVHQGVATLQGSIPNEHARARALAIAEGTEGVTEVIDELYRR